MQVSTWKNEKNSTYMGGAGNQFTRRTSQLKKKKKHKVHDGNDQNDKHNKLRIGSRISRAGFVRTRILKGTTKTILQKKKRRRNITYSAGSYKKQNTNT